MIRPTIAGVVFDLGGTLEEVYYDDATRLTAAGGLKQLLEGRGLDPGLPAPALCTAVIAGMAAYQRQRMRTERELPPEQVWTEHIFPGRGFPVDRLAAAAEELTFYYEHHFFTRTMRPDAPALLECLRAHGLRLAVISNIISRTLVPHQLATYGIDRYFESIMTSAEFGYRKPHPSIFLEAARRIGLAPASCAYVGDTVSRDVAGARRAGYGLAIQIPSYLTDKSDGAETEPAPDAVVQDLLGVAPLVLSPASAEVA